MRTDRVSSALRGLNTLRSECAACFQLLLGELHYREFALMSLRFALIITNGDNAVFVVRQLQFNFFRP